MEEDIIPPLVQLANRIRNINAANGWDTPAWDDPNPYAVPGKLALIHSELSEALEAFREGDKDHFAEELADTAIRLLDLAYGMDIDLDGAVDAKLEVNATRGYRHGGKRV